MRDGHCADAEAVLIPFYEDFDRPVETAVIDDGRIQPSSYPEGIFIWVVWSTYDVNILLWCYATPTRKQLFSSERAILGLLIWQKLME